MNIDDLKFGDLKTINEMFSLNQQQSKDIFKSYIGKYVICRTRNEGVNCGFVKDLDETGVILDKARRMWYHDTASDLCWYEGISIDGPSDDTKLSASCEKLIVEDYSLTICSEKASIMLVNMESHKKG